MGMNYYLKCLDCSKESKPVEFCICKEYRVKFVPGDLETLERDWVPFIVKHGGHRIALVDWRGYTTDPTKINGGYVLGLTPYRRGFSSGRASFSRQQTGLPPKRERKKKGGKGEKR